MENPFKNDLDFLFDKIITSLHNYQRLNTILLKEIAKYETDESIYLKKNELVIEDWSDEDSSKWSKYFSTKISVVSRKENYESDIRSILSREFSFGFSQCYESFETYLKNIIMIKNSLEIKSGKDVIPHSREKLRGYESLFKLLKKSGGSHFKKFSESNHKNFDFKILFIIHTEVRHAITHSGSILDGEKFPVNPEYSILFNYLFPNNKLDRKKIQLDFDEPTLDRNLIILAEFAFQIYKIFSLEEKLEWEG